MKKKIFITGGGGYVGCALSDYLIDKVMKFLFMIFFCMGKMFLKISIKLI